MTDKNYPPPCRNYLQPLYLSVTLYACAQRVYIVLYRNTIKNIKISLNKIWFTYTALIPTKMMFSLLNKCKFWFKCVSWTNDQNTGKGCTVIVKCPLPDVTHLRRCERQYYKTKVYDSFRYVSVRLKQTFNTVTKYCISQARFWYQN